MEAPLKHLTGALIDQLAALATGLPFLGVDEWRRQFEVLIIQYHAAAYFAGKGKDELDARGDRLLGATMQQQIDRLAKFAEVAESLSEAQLTARSALYAGALKASYSQGQHSGLLDLPFYPGDGGTECLGNCKCAWDVTIEDAEDLDARAVWTLHAEESCQGCLDREAGNPYVFVGGVLQ